MTDNRPEPTVYRARDGTLLAFNSTKTEVSANDIWTHKIPWSNVLESVGTTSIRSFDLAMDTNTWTLTIGADCCYSPQQPTTDVTKGKSNTEYFCHLLNIYSNN